RRSPQDMVSALLEEERAKEPENRACAADPAQPLLDTNGKGETVQATVTDQGTDGRSGGFPRPGWRQSSWPSLRRADETRGADPMALKPTLATLFLRVLQRGRPAIIGSAPRHFAVPTRHLADLLGEPPWRPGSIRPPRMSYLGSPASCFSCARRSAIPRAFGKTPSPGNGSGFMHSIASRPRRDRASSAPRDAWIGRRDPHPYTRLSMLRSFENLGRIRSRA